MSNGEFSVSKEKADYLYEKAGELIEEDPPGITFAKYEHLLLHDQVDLIINKVLHETGVSQRFKLQEFQLLTLHCLGNKKNVILISPTGSGKMLCAQLGILVLKKVFEMEKGVGLGSMPLSALMEEKLKSDIVKSGLITMQGGLKGNSDASLSEPKDSFIRGAMDMIYGHAESWSTSIAKEIIDNLRKEDRIIFSFIDEFKMNLSSFWGSSFR